MTLDMTQVFGENRQTQYYYLIFNACAITWKSGLIRYFSHRAIKMFQVLLAQIRN